MDNVLFTITVDNAVTVWAPINSWEPHILYQRASISMDSSQTPIPSNTTLSSFYILVDSAELTRALETVFNKMNTTDTVVSDRLAKVAEIARKSPEICLVLNQHDDSLCVWGIDVNLWLSLKLQLIREASRLQEWQTSRRFQDIGPSATTGMGQ
jgi:hypothetical protein